MQVPARWRPWALTAIAVTAAVSSVAVVSASHAWGNYHWERSSNPVALDVGDNFSDSVWDQFFVTAVSDWNQSSVLTLTPVLGATSPRRCKPATGRIEVCADTYGNTGWLGLAQIWVSGDHITQAAAKMNDSYFRSAPYDSPAWRQFVMCQEIGHTFGLGHQDEDFTNGNLGTCMDYTGNPVGPPSNLHPNAHDYGELETIYTHLDSSGGSDGGGGGRGNGRGGGAGVNLPPPAMDQIDFATPEQWGQLVSQTANGRGAIYELDFGGGFKVLTHVLWADPDADAR